MLLLFIRSYILLPLGFLQLALFLEWRFRIQHFDLLWLVMFVLLLSGGFKIWSKWSYLDAKNGVSGISARQHKMWQFSLLVIDPMVSLIGLLRLYLSVGFFISYQMLSWKLAYGWLSSLAHFPF